MKIYDNGTCVLGQVEDIKKYILKNCEEDYICAALIEDLKDLKSDTIVIINYDLGMGYSIEYWDTTAIVED